MGFVLFCSALLAFYSVLYILKFILSLKNVTRPDRFIRFSYKHLIKLGYVNELYYYIENYRTSFGWVLQEYANV